MQRRAIASTYAADILLGIKLGQPNATLSGRRASKREPPVR
jgi:hypothetical protein